MLEPNLRRLPAALRLLTASIATLVTTFGMLGPRHRKLDSSRASIGSRRRTLVGGPRMLDP